tara:strand:- start:480 stop:716 length:237 start_codon:yes stop_codon:yes gene_type:complete
LSFDKDIIIDINIDIAPRNGAEANKKIPILKKMNPYKKLFFSFKKYLLKNFASISYETIILRKSRYFGNQTSYEILAF